MMKQETVKYFLIRILILLLALAIVMAIYHGARFFLVVFAGALIAILWRGVAHWISEKTKIKFRWALLFMILFFIGSLTLFIIIISPNISEQSDRLAREIPKVVDQIESSLENTAIGRNILDNIKQGDMSGDQVKQAFDVIGGAMNFFVDAILILAFALFLAADPKLYRRGLLYLIPKKHQTTTRNLLDRQENVLFRWFIGKIIDMFSIFVMTFVGLWLLDMPMIFTFALIAFFFSFVPNIGPVISAIPPMAIALLESPQKMLYVGLLYLGIQITESYFITPNVQKRASYVPPVILLLVQFLLAKFLGVLGLFLSTPLLVMIMVTVNMLYVENYLGNTDLEPVKSKS